jgi:hypothetical protein
VIIVICREIMKIKQIKSFFLAFVLTVSTVAGVLSLSSTVQAYKCPTGQEFHSEDNSCWTKDIGTPQVTGGGKATGCSNGVTYRKSDNPPCVNYTRTNAVPMYEDGTTATLSCGAGQEYHSSDNKCWTYQLPSNCARENNTNCKKEWVDKGYPTSISKDYKADYCGSNFPQETQACKDGQNSEADCSKYTDATQKDACAEGYATQACGVNTGGGTANSADARQECYKGVKDCLTSDKPLAEQKKCVAGVSGVDPKEAKKIDPDSGVGGTGKNCGEAQTVLISCEGKGTEALGNVLRIFISVLTVIIGIAAVGGLAWASVLYAKAEDNASEVKEARALIRSIVIGILLYGFLVGIINWLVPGGVIG